MSPDTSESSTPTPLPPSFLANPVIAQAELVRQLARTTDAQEQLELLQQSASGFNIPEALALLSYTVEMARKGQLVGDMHQRAALLKALADVLIARLQELEPLHLGQLLWNLSVTDIRAPWMDSLVNDIAEQELQRGRAAAYNTQDLSNILCGAGNILTMAAANPTVQQYAASLVKVLDSRMETPYVRGGFTAADFTDLVSAMANVFSGFPKLEKGQPKLNVPSEVCSLYDKVASEIRRQLANRHSLRSPFSPRDLVRFVQSYARLFAATGTRSGTSFAMLDVLATFVVTRVKARHLNAVSRPWDIAGLLQAYADLEHRSVVIPELLSAMGEQLRRGAASEQERLQSSTPSGAPELSVPITALTSIFISHERLGYRPDDLTLQSLLPGLVRELGATDPRDVVDLLRVLSALGLRPGPTAVDLMLARVASDEGDEESLLKDARMYAEQLNV